MGGNPLRTSFSTPDIASAGSKKESNAKPRLIDKLSPPPAAPTTKRNKETLEWLNPLVARFFQNIRVNREVIEKAKTKLAVKMAQKVAEKKLAGYLSDVKVDDVDLGDVVPHISHAKLKESCLPGEVVLRAVG